MLLLGSGIVGGASLAWAVVFLLWGNWLAAGFETFAVGANLFTARLVRQGRVRAASRLLIAVMYVLVCIYATVLDIPTAAVPRSMHEFLLALGVIACLLLRDERPGLRHGVPLLCFLTFAALGASDFSVHTAFGLPDDLRARGNWVNHAMVAVLVYSALHVLQTDVAERNGLENELRDALVHGDLLLHYQPQVGTGDHIIGAEALVRWNHPRRGMVPPGEFIPLAERCGLMEPLGDWVLRTACAQLATWQQRPESAKLALSVNVSAVQFAQPDFVARVLGRVEQSGIDPSRLKLELTESMLAEDVDDIIAKMKALKTRGIGFSLDDFGTGFSSLNYLRRLPLDQLKIDQSFVRNMLQSDSDAAIAQTVVTLGRSLGLAVIAEGVETPEQRQALAAIGCSTYQGYLFGRPVPIADFDRLVTGGLARCPMPAEAPMADRDTNASDLALGSLA
jgi:EAL domain-containing protein (putative c-di-GMP-specific phosphodiesterase class I)